MIYVVQKGDQLCRQPWPSGLGSPRPGCAATIGLGSQTSLWYRGQALAGAGSHGHRTPSGQGIRCGVLPGQTGVPLRQLLQYNPTLAQGHPLYPGEVLALAWQGNGKAVFCGRVCLPHVLPGVLRQALPFDHPLLSFPTASGGWHLVVPEDRALLAEAQRFRVGAMLVLTSMDESGNFLPSGRPNCSKTRPSKTVCWMNWWPSYWKRGTRVWTWI